MLKVGTCGWTRVYQAFPRSEREGKTVLQWYAQHFPVVEINSSYYKYHKVSTYEKWREETPDHFEFTVKCHKFVSQRPKIEPTREILQSFERTVEGAKACDAKAILIQTPKSLRATREVLEGAERFFDSIDSKGIPLMWETRGESWNESERRRNLALTLEKYGITHVTDPLKLDPTFVKDIAYLRLHGLPGYNLRYTYTNAELRRLHEKVKKYDEKAKTIYVFFNNYAMYRDAERFIHLIRSGELPQSPFGPRSVLYALRPFEDWPATKRMLLRKCGGWFTWVGPDKSVKLKEMLRYVRDREYANLGDLESEVKAIWNRTGFREVLE